MPTTTNIADLLMAAGVHVRRAGAGAGVWLGLLPDPLRRDPGKSIVWDDAEFKKLVARLDRMIVNAKIFAALAAATLALAFLK